MALLFASKISVSLRELSDSVASELIVELSHEDHASDNLLTISLVLWEILL